MTPATGAIMDGRTYECDYCDGAGEVPCDCVRCRTDEGMAFGVWNHTERVCPKCGGSGELPEECVGCGEPVGSDAIDADGWYCPECAAVYVGEVAA